MSPPESSGVREWCSRSWRSSCSPPEASRCASANSSVTSSSARYCSLSASPASMNSSLVLSVMKGRPFRLIASALQAKKSSTETRRGKLTPSFFLPGVVLLELWLGTVAGRSSDEGGRAGSVPNPPGYCTVLDRRDYAGRSQAFRTLRDGKLNTLPFVERFVSVGLDGRVVNEHIVPTFPGDEPVALRCVE